jgi:tetratricopeptide (TPR) repeat protein
VRVVVKQGRLVEVPRWAERAGAAVARLGDDPVAEARLDNELGTFAYIEQKHEDAVTRYRQALELRRAALGEAHPDVAATLANLGNALHGLDRFDEALAAYNESLKIRETTLGPDHPDVAATLNNMGVLFKTRGKNDEALAVLLRAQDIWTRALGPTTRPCSARDEHRQRLPRPERARPRAGRARGGRRPDRARAPARSPDPHHSDEQPRRDLPDA